MRFDELPDGKAFRFATSGPTVFVKVNEWTIRTWDKDKTIPLWGENGHPPTMRSFPSLGPTR